MLLRDLQSLLGRIYGLDIDADVADYLITDRQYLYSLLGDDAERIEETLLILEEEDVLDIALYLDNEMLTRVSESDPCKGLRQHNLDEFCKVLEGVSHFVYVAWNASRDKQITRLELEMQAEVDKYVSSRLLLESQQAGNPNLLSALFDNVRYLQHLQPHVLARYQHANATAGRYCRNLEQRFPYDSRGSVQPTGFSNSMLHELRAFYRMPQPDKISHIHTAQFA